MEPPVASDSSNLNPNMPEIEDIVLCVKDKHKCEHKQMDKFSTLINLVTVSSIYVFIMKINPHLPLQLGVIY